MAKFKHACGKSYNNPKPWSIPLQTNFLSRLGSGYPSDSKMLPQPCFCTFSNTLGKATENLVLEQTSLGSNLGFILYKLRTLNM